MPTRARFAVVGAWTIGLGAIVFARYRGSLVFYRGLHERLAALGIPDFVRNLDYAVIVLAAVALAALLARAVAGVPPRRALALVRPARGGLLATAVAAAPMVFGGTVLHFVRATSTPGFEATAVYRGAVQAPILEEFLFRGVLVLLPLALLGARSLAFWPLALLGGAAFGLVHATWTPAGLAAGWPNVLVTGVGGVWYAWLARAWGSLFVPMLLHAAMNLGWLLMGGEGGAGGGGIVENALRAATIAIATAWTIRGRRVRE